jgi:hypothetical protein
MNSNKQQLSPYWNRIVTEAEDILTRQLSELEKKTVSPDFCILKEDQYRMARQEMEIDGIKSIIDTVKEGGTWGKIWAVDTVLKENPSLVFKFK